MASLRIPSTMKAPRFIGNGQIDFTMKPVPEPGPGQLLIEVKANALCGSEKKQFLNGTSVTPGHEAAGIVVAAGFGAGVPVGTPGVIFLMDFCGECRSCQAGFTNQCLHKRGDMGFNKDGGYAPYMLIHQNLFFPVDPSFPLTEATLLLDIMGTGGHALKRARLVHPDIQSLLISGAGPIGLGVLAMSKLLFEQLPVFITDIVPYRLQLAEKLGGIPIYLQETSLEKGLQSGGFSVVDAAIDTSGKSAARQASVKVLAKRGVLVCVGHGESLHLEVSPDLIATERAVLGSEYFCFDEIADNWELLRGHRSNLNQIITHKYPVEQIQAAFDLFFTGETGKVVIEQ